MEKETKVYNISFDNHSLEKVEYYAIFFDRKYAAILNNIINNILLIDDLKYCTHLYSIIPTPKPADIGKIARVEFNKLVYYSCFNCLMISSSKIFIVIAINDMNNMKYIPILLKRKPDFTKELDNIITLNGRIGFRKIIPKTISEQFLLLEKTIDPKIESKEVIIPKIIEPQPPLPIQPPIPIPIQPPPQPKQPEQPEQEYIQIDNFTVMMPSTSPPIALDCKYIPFGRTFKGKPVYKGPRDGLVTLTKTNKPIYLKKTDILDP